LRPKSTESTGDTGLTFSKVDTGLATYVRLRAMFVGVALMAACGGSEPVDCPNLSTTCPDPKPSYASDVRPIINARCPTCHSPGGQEPSRHSTTYGGVRHQPQAVLTQAHSGS